jgi:hypothetical protein
MASSNQLKEYLKQEVQKAIGLTISTEDFDKVMGAFAIAIDKYLKQDIKVDMNIESEGILDITNAFPTPVPNAQTIYEVETKTSTKGNLV